MGLTVGNLPYPEQTDSVDVVRDLKALAEALDLRVPVKGGTAMVPFNGSLPTVATARIQVNIGQSTTNAGGIINITWPTPYLTRVLFAVATTMSGSAYNPVINSSAISLTGMTLFWQNTPNTTVSFAHLSIGY